MSTEQLRRGDGPRELFAFDRKSFEKSEERGLGAYRAGLKTLGVADEWLAKADELLQGDHTSGDDILLGGSHARAIDIGREVLEEAIYLDSRVNLHLTDPEVLAVGDLYMSTHRKREGITFKDRLQERKDRRSAMSIIKKNKILRNYVLNHRECFLPTR